MANGSHTGLATQRAPYGEPQPAPVEAPPTKRDLASWWKQFKKENKKDKEKGKLKFQPTAPHPVSRKSANENHLAPAPPPNGIFGVPLAVSIQYAHVAISLFDDNGRSFIYGYVPIIVAKCGVFLKEKATDVEGIFRLAGAERRIKELQALFNSPDRYGKGLDWTGYTVHDAANVLRRYLNQLPEPIIPLDFYQRFRDPLRDHQSEAVGKSDLQAPDVGKFDVDAAIKTYQMLITELPPLNRQLLLYILDLVAVFASKSETNRMTASNLAAIFQPGLLSHPEHDMAPSEYRLSQDVLIFLIQKQDHFLVGMQGTAADEKTIQDVQSGAQSPQKGSESPSAAKQMVGRSASSASAGADSVRKYGGVRRNVSVSSRNSRQSAGASSSPVTPPPGSPYSASGKGSGVHRSNTMPAKKHQSPKMASGRLSRERSSEHEVTSPPTPIITSPMASPAEESSTAPGTEAAVPQSSPLGAPFAIGKPEDTSHLKPLSLDERGRQMSQDSPSMKSGKATGDMTSSARSPGQSAADTPTKERSFSGFFSKSISPGSERKDGRRPNRLQKRRTESQNTSAQSSAHDLDGQPPSPGSGHLHAEALGIDKQDDKPNTNVLDTAESVPHADAAPVEPVAAIPLSLPPDKRTISDDTIKPDLDSSLAADDTAGTSTALKDMPQRASGVTLKPNKSPSSQKSASSTNETSEAETNDDAATADAKKEKRRIWRMSRPEKRVRSQSNNNLGVIPAGGAARSSSTIGSADRPRKSFTDESTSQAVGSSDTSPPGASRTLSPGPEGENGSAPQEKRGPIGWFRGKLQERKEREAEKERAKSPSSRDDSERRESAHSMGQVIESAAEQPRPPPDVLVEEGSGEGLDMPEPQH